MKNVALIYGGHTSEYEVSLRSSASIFHHLDKNYFSITLIGVAKNGRFYLQENSIQEGNSLSIREDKEKLISVIPFDGFYYKNKKLDIDVVFPMVHGTYGEDGTLQGLLEQLHLPYVGATVLGSAVGMDKAITKQLLLYNNIAVIPFRILYRHNLGNTEKVYKDIIRDFNLPLFVKPARGGSSVGVSMINNYNEFLEAINIAFRYDTKILVEKKAVGREIECSVIGNAEVSSFPPGEIASSHQFYDYDAKYIDPDGAKLIIPADLPKELLQKVQKIAEASCFALEINGYARVDFFVKEESGEIFVNEINTTPGFTSISMFPQMCNAAGLPYEQLLTKLIELAENQFAVKNSLRYEK